MILRYWADKEGSSVGQYNADPQAIAKVLYTPQVRGITGTKMEEYLRGQGFQTFVLAASLSDLAHHLSRGRPLIVCIKPKQNGGRLHYLVVAGVDFREGIILVNDPAQRKLLKVNAASFEQAWTPAHHWTLLAVPERHQLPIPPVGP
jgi:ABC-type bacteriocin/lantibiotic exporter with double-glycine peptidase domain